MRRTSWAILPWLLALSAASRAQTEPPKPLSLDATVTLTSDYRFRGISQSNRRPAIQGTANVVHSSGIYAGTFVSTIGDYVTDGANPEIDLYGGVRKTFGGTTIDGGLLYYIYPDTVSYKGDYWEPFISIGHTLGPVTAKVGANYSWKQHALQNMPGERRYGFYTYAELSGSVPNTPVTLVGHVGHVYHGNYSTFGARYTDWSLGAGYQWKQLMLSVAYVDTDANIRSYPTGGGHDRNVSGAGLMASASIGF